MASVYLCTSIL